jgi:RNA polymerase sigma-70 factor (ECF subfamily)
MLRTARGDEEAFRLLVARWENQLFAFLYHMVGSVDEAEDLAQDVLLRVYAKADRYRPQGKFPSWLFRIAGNQARSWLRRRRIRRWMHFDLARHDRPDPGLPPDDDLARKQLREAVRRALARLPARQRQAVLLRRYHGLSYLEIAEALGTTRAAVESLLQRAAAALRRDLAREVDLV